MKVFCLFLAIFLFSITAPAAGLPFDTVTEKRFVTVSAEDPLAPFLLNTATADLWKLSPETMEWIFFGRPRGANSERKGTYQLRPYKPGEILVFNSASGEMWWTDGVNWKIIKKPSRSKKPGSLKTSGSPTDERGLTQISHLDTNV